MGSKPQHSVQMGHRHSRLCTAMCLACSRCSVASVSLKYRDCSWFDACDMTRLSKKPAGFHSVRLAPDRRGSIGVTAHKRNYREGQARSGTTCGVTDAEEVTMVPDPFCCKAAGSFHLPQEVRGSWEAASAWCLGRTSVCDIANISVSLQHSDCSWYKTCTPTEHAAFRSWPVFGADRPAVPFCHGNSRNSTALLLALASAGHIASRRRVMFPTVPSSGSSWLRALVEAARGVASETVYHQEGGRWHSPTLSFGNACGAFRLHSKGTCATIHTATTERVMIKTHFPFATYLWWESKDRHLTLPALIGGVIKTTRDPRAAFDDCVRKNYAGVKAGGWNDFITRVRRFHAYWDGMALSGIPVVNVDFAGLSSPRYVEEVLMQLRDAFFPEITPERARLAVISYPHRARNNTHTHT